MTMTRADRRFLSTLLLVFGPLFVAGGFLAAFTLEGTVYVYIGVAMFVTGILLRTRLPLLAALVGGVLVLAALILNMVRDY
jgi:hypothetical protein